MMMITMIMMMMSMITTMMIVNLRQTRNPDIQSILRPQGNRHATVCTLGQVWSPCANNVCTFAPMICMYWCKERLYFIYCISPFLKYKCCEGSVNYWGGLWILVLAASGVHAPSPIGQLWWSRGVTVPGTLYPFPPPPHPSRGLHSIMCD